MTAPADQSDLQALLDKHANLILAIELAATVAATASLVRQLGQVQRDIAAAWILTVGALTAIPTPEQSRVVRTAVVTALRNITVDISPTITQYAVQAAETATRQARVEADVVGPGVATPPPILFEPGTHHPIPQQPPAPERPASVLSDELTETIDRVDDTVQARIDAAVDRVQDQALESWGQVTDTLSVANQARGTAEQATAWTINRAAAEAVEAEAVTVGAELLWVAERTACVACLAYSGHTTTPGGSFPIGLTYGTRPVTPWPDPKHLPGPPLHNRCRCRLMLWLGHDTQAAAAALPQGASSAHIDYPAALRREADRSILRGFHLPSESERVRLRAAERLLAKGVQAPESVKRMARGAVRRGKWLPRKIPTP